MKKTVNFLLVVMFAFASVNFVGCKNKKKLATGGKTPKGEQEIIIPCSGVDYFSNDKYFRANAVGESIDQMTSKKKAMCNAKAQMASDIQTTMKVVSDNYVKSSEFNNKEEVLERFEENARTVVNQELRGVRTICEKLVKTQEGKYKTYLALELSGEELLNKYSEILGNDENLKIDYNYEKFKATFNEEMDKMNK